MAATLAAKTAFFVATKRWCRVEFVVGIGPNHTGLQLAAEAKNTRTVGRPDSCGEAIGWVIGFLNHLFHCAESLDGEYWAKDLFLGDSRTLRNVSKKCGFAVESLARKRALWLIYFCALGQTDGEVFFDCFELLFGVDGADVGVFVQRIAHINAL